jgi:hypothetical protein
MGTAPGLFQDTIFQEFICDCGAKFEDSLYKSISHVAVWHCDPTRMEDPQYFEGRVATMISPNPIDFISNEE